MLKYENRVADYIKASGNHYIRYRVTPIWRGNELLARGVQMEAQSIGDNSVRFNVYIFNVQPGVALNYKDGTSRVGKTTNNQFTKRTVKASVKKTKKQTVKKNRIIKSKRVRFQPQSIE